jgi:hypothetical protein
MSTTVIATDSGLVVQQCDPRASSGRSTLIDRVYCPGAKIFTVTVADGSGAIVTRTVPISAGGCLEIIGSVIDAADKPKTDAEIALEDAAGAGEEEGRHG